MNSSCVLMGSENSVKVKDPRKVCIHIRWGIDTANMRRKADKLEANVSKYRRKRILFFSALRYN